MKTKYFDVKDAGISVKCKLYYGEGHTFSRVVLACHGFGGNKDNAITQKLAETLLPVHKDTAVLAFDWPCHGEDVKQKLSLQDCTRYLETVVQYARHTLGAKALLASGNSFGGYLLLKHLYEKENPFEKILLRCPAVCMYQALMQGIVKSGQAESLKKKDALVGTDKKIRVCAAFVEELRNNDITTWDYTNHSDEVLILQGTKDELIPHDVVQAFADQNGLDMISVENADHRFRDPVKTREFIDYAMQYFFE